MRKKNFNSLIRKYLNFQSLQAFRREIVSLLLALALPTIEYVCSLRYETQGVNRTLGAKDELKGRTFPIISVQTMRTLNFRFKSRRCIHKTIIDQPNTQLIHWNANHSAYTLANSSFIQSISSLKSHLVNQMHQ